MLVHWIWFSLLCQGRERMQLMQHFRDPEELFHCDERALPELPKDLADRIGQKDLSRAQRILDTCVCKNIGILAYGDGAYPSKLKNIYDPPAVLYYKGHLPDWESVPVIGIVGTRKASAYGMENARRFGGEIASGGAIVVSGAASGIDGAAMEYAMAQGKPVVGVLGCGVDVVFPKSNRELFAAVEKQGCLLSEYVPGTAPLKWNFPRRNRIISGMANGVLVVEAPERSGALITARDAAEQGRDVFAVPGNINCASCAGSNALLNTGAIAVFSGWDVLKEYAPLYPEKVKKPASIVPVEEKLPETDKKSIDKPVKSGYSDRVRPTPDMTEQERTVYTQLTGEPEQTDVLIARTGMPAGEVLRILTKLAIRGAVQKHPGGRFSRK